MSSKKLTLNSNYNSHSKSTFIKPDWYVVDLTSYSDQNFLKCINYELQTQILNSF